MNSNAKKPNDSPVEAAPPALSHGFGGETDAMILAKTSRASSHQYQYPGNDWQSNEFSAGATRWSNNKQRNSLVENQTINERSDIWPFRCQLRWVLLGEAERVKGRKL
jgi:hypothetical protein